MDNNIIEVVTKRIVKMLQNRLYEYLNERKRMGVA